MISQEMARLLLLVLSGVDQAANCGDCLLVLLKVRPIAVSALLRDFEQGNSITDSLLGDALWKQTVPASWSRAIKLCEQTTNR